jgi:membrane protein DedA with SNARE-associated domain
MTELAIIVAVAAVLFGVPAVIAYWLGYRAGRRAGSDDE